MGIIWQIFNWGPMSSEIWKTREKRCMTCSRKHKKRFCSITTWLAKHPITLWTIPIRVKSTIQCSSKLSHQAPQIFRREASGMVHHNIHNHRQLTKEAKMEQARLVSFNYRQSTLLRNSLPRLCKEVSLKDNLWFNRMKNSGLRLRKQFLICTRETYKLTLS
jgi:hypothetical protein